MVCRSNVCPTCKKRIGHLFAEFDRQKKEYLKERGLDDRDIYFDENISYNDIFMSLGIGPTKICCRKWMVCGVAIDDSLFINM